MPAPCHSHPEGSDMCHVNSHSVLVAVRHAIVSPFSQWPHTLTARSAATHLSVNCNLSYRSAVAYSSSLSESTFFCSRLLASTIAVNFRQVSFFLFSSAMLSFVVLCTLCSLLSRLNHWSIIIPFSSRLGRAQ